MATMTQPAAPAPLASVQLIHCAELLSAHRQQTVQLLQQRLAPAAQDRVVNMVTSAPLQQLAAQVVDPKASPALVQLDPAQWPAGLEADADQYKALLRPVHIRQVSNALHHKAALDAVAACPSCDDAAWSLVVEDDALFADDVIGMLRRVVDQAPPDADLVFLGLPSTLQPSDSGNMVFDDALARFSILPACESYLVRKRAAARLSAELLPLRFPTHVQLTWLARRLGLRVRLCVPNVFVDGSKLGAFTSSLDPNNRLLWNQAYCQAEALLRSDVYEKDPARAEREFDIITKQQQAAFSGSPDMLALRAAHLTRLGRAAQAEAAYQVAYDAYAKIPCLLNNTCDFLRGYMNLYRSLQQEPEPQA